MLASAFERIRQVRPDSKLVLVGDGPAREALQRRCPQAVFTGIRKGEELARHYASGDMFLFPSLTETFGNVTPEAMASGLAVLAFNHAAASELIRSGENGMVAQPGNDGQFGDLAARLAMQPDELARLRQRARQTTLQLGWPSIIQEIEGVYAALRKPAAQVTSAPAGKASSTPAQTGLLIRPAEHAAGSLGG